MFGMPLADALTFARPKVPSWALLGLNTPRSGDRRGDQCFFASPLLQQRLSILKNMVGGNTHLIVVVGERGSGKTTLMNQFLTRAGRQWRTGRMRVKPADLARQDPWCHLNNRMVFLSNQSRLPSVMIDDAHQLSPAELKLLLKTAFPPSGARRIQSVVLFAEPQLRERYSEIIRYLPQFAVIDKFAMTPLTEKQTADYLQHRIKNAGFLKSLPFSSEQIRRIHSISGGLPGWINGEAYLLLRRLFGHPAKSPLRYKHLRLGLSLGLTKRVGPLILKGIGGCLANFKVARLKLTPQ